MNNSNSGGITFLGLLTLIFVYLRLTEEIDWSWWWVLSPIWIPLAVFVVLVAIVALVTALLSSKKKSRPATNDPFDHPFFRQ